ncbi:thiol reductant ABC exporter subunit CydD [Agromyces protaetiae]|uniref:thiol reductant ABC exporter subunit CydD n=1 Tax=Agromyces protaetiae TaxID=2509455 RepID=UPI0013EBBEDF|nr:thiol reductant ABC exporter subunit CydD [Agromyces protaetiae]
MKPLDPRLVRRSRGARRFLAAGAAIALVQTGAIAAFAWGLAELVAGLVGSVGRSDASTAAALVAAAVVVRALSTWAWDAVSTAGAQRVKAEFRAEILEALDGRPEGVPGFPSARIATLLGPGLDALDEYFGRYLPQLVLTAIATPLLVAAAWWGDWLSGLTFVLVLPIIPVFMILIGLATQAVQRRQWDALETLSRGFLEVLGGLSTLLVFGRAKRQSARIAAVTDEYRVRTMRVLRVTFLSGFALELAASLSVALVAVSIGFRLVDGSLALAVGLFVLVLAPEIFLPLRNVGAAFHSAAGGVTASVDALDLVEAAARTGNVADVSEPTDSDGRGLVVRDLVVRRDDRVVVEGLDLAVAPGEVVAVVGPSGVGKSSLVAAILGFVDHEGEISVGGASGPGLPAVAWAPQRSSLVAGTVASNVTMGDPDASPAILDRALALAGVDVDPASVLGAGGEGVSGGQAQRIAVARAIHRLLARDLALLVVDEPSSALDHDREEALAHTFCELAGDGRAVLVVTHRPSLAAAADRVVALGVLADVR